MNEAAIRSYLNIYTEFYHPEKKMPAKRRDPALVDHFFIRRHPITQSKCVFVRFKDNEKAVFTADTLSPTSRA